MSEGVAPAGQVTGNMQKWNQLLLDVNKNFRSQHK